MSTDIVAPERRGWRRRLVPDSWAVTLTMAVILVVATLLRVLGNRWGLPMRLHPDEWAVVDGVIDMARRNSFEPPWNLRPDHVEMKLDYVAFAGYAQLFRGQSIEAAFAADPSPFFVIARSMTALFGVGTVVLAFLVGRRISALTGLVAAGLFALFPSFVKHAHYATPDVPLTFAVMLTVYALMRYLDNPAARSLLLASFGVALGVGIKYPGAVAAAMIAVVVVLAAVRDRAWLRVVRHGVLSIAGVAGFLFLISPVLFTNASGVWSDFTANTEFNWFGVQQLGFVGNLRFYFSDYSYDAGVLLMLLTLVGVAVAVVRRDLRTVPWLTGVLLWLALSAVAVHWDRWGLPMYVTPLLFAALGLSFLVETWWASRAKWAVLAVTAVVGLQLFAGAAVYVAQLLASDTRPVALAYSEKHGITPRESAFEGYTQFDPDEPKVIFKQLDERGGELVAFTKTRRPAKYVVLSSGMFSRVLGKPGYPTENDLYEQIFDTYTEVHKFVPAVPGARSVWEPLAIWRRLQLVRDLAGGDMWGPEIRIYRVPADR